MQLPDAEIVFKNLAKKIQSDQGKDFALIGIYTGGVWLAERLHQELEIAQPLGTLDVSFYRDDFDKIGLHSQVKRSEIPFEVEGAHILLMDDVLYTGRTIRAAINELFDYGRPASVSLATLVDRGGRELPIAAQYTGIELELPANKMLELKRGESGKLSLNLYDRVHPE
ncbi:bifunctional pyr operon transcriptional regulator/uracil phosphoribosyltransferase PyrR [Nitrosomonas sp. Nm166]|uniref:bifunctional pyr operon transcriptional regulator/uracil phosphoribosyltransferase PyrR n=1 Tax=Nitrosomonas sp. Nm166 TaxID=1881054 RepID=UPI0008EBF634|nr:bifunctional pyr operon transcriptional regulator/uracil phosphoribosyltransferase PyrR [Nitrosomonas sp. Nm166]SFE73450.1 pyrimidine operon attenuation protein / uracil phosphoribosyltransferase [Nitrosomonas sp. Nm166]